jgi:hypothetical protein
MPKIQLQGKVFELDTPTYLSALHGISKATLQEARRACNDHRYGSINANGSQHAKLLRKKDEFHKALLIAIEDPELEKYFNNLDVLAKKIQQQDRKMINWLAAYYHIPLLNSTEGRKKFNQKLTRERQKAIGNRSGLLGWVYESEWQNLEAEYLTVVASIGEVTSKINERLKLLGLEHEG